MSIYKSSVVVGCKQFKQFKEINIECICMEDYVQYVHVYTSIYYKINTVVYIAFIH